MAIPLRRSYRDRRLRARPASARPQALSARADARAVVPLQSRLRRLRQDRLSRRDPQSAPISVADCLARGRRMRRAGGRHRRRRAAAAPGACQRSSRASSPRKKFVYRLHQRAAAGEEARPVSSRTAYFNWSVHLDGDKEMHDKSVCQAGVYDRAVEAHPHCQGEGLPGQHQLHAVQRCRCRARRASSSIRVSGARRRRHHRVAGLRL